MVVLLICSVLVLSCRVSPRTLLMYCTNGVLLRALMSGDSSLSSVTHVIVVRSCRSQHIVPPSRWYWQLFLVVVVVMVVLAGGVDDCYLWW